MLNQQYCWLCMQSENEFIQREYCLHSYCKDCHSTLYQFTNNRLKCPMCECSYTSNIQITKEIQISLLKELQSEFCCPICDYLIVQPVVLKNCQHLYCYTCLINILDKTQSFECFVCGQLNNLPSKLRINENLQNLIAKFWPDQYKKRFFYQDLQQKILRNSLKLRLSYGNKHKMIDNNIHQWIGFVNLATCRENQKNILEEPEELIQSVKFILPQSYKKNECKLQFAPFQIIRKTYCPCTIDILVKFRGQFGLQDMELRHTLNFEKDIDFNSIVFVLDQHKLNFQKLCYILPKIELTRKQYNFNKLRFSIICGLSIISNMQFMVFIEMRQILQDLKYQKQNQLPQHQVDGEKLIENIVINYKKTKRSWDTITKRIFQPPFSQTVARKDIERIKVQVTFQPDLELISQQYTLDPSQLKGDLLKQETTIRIDFKRLTEYIK